MANKPSDIPIIAAENLALRTNPASFSVNADANLIFQSRTLPAAINEHSQFMNDTKDEVAAAALAGDLPDITGQAGNLIGVNGAEDGVEFSAPIVSQCRLSYTSASACTLTPKEGDKVKISGALYPIPSAGVTLANTGLTAGTLYYVYIYNNAGTLTLEASVTGHSTDTSAGNLGVEVKTGDNTRTLVGMTFLIDNGGTPEFKDENGYRLVASWFNRRSRPVRAERSTLSSSTSTSLVEISTAEFLTWGEQIKGGQNGSIYGVAGFQGVSAVYVDSVADDNHIASSSTTFPANSHRFDASSSGVTRAAVSEGRHEIGLYIASATATYPVNHTKAMLAPFSSIFAEVSI